MIFYKTADNRLIDEDKLRDAYFYLFGECASYNDLNHFSSTCKGITGFVENPSPKYMLLHGEYFNAIKVYRDENECSINEAKQYIDQLKDELEEQPDFNSVKVELN